MDPLLMSFNTNSIYIQ